MPLPALSNRSRIVAGLATLLLVVGGGVIATAALRDEPKQPAPPASPADAQLVSAWSRPGLADITDVRVAGQLVLAETTDQVVALDPETGEQRWAVDGVGRCGIDPLSSSRILVVASGTRCRVLTAWSLTDGTRLWSQRFGRNQDLRSFGVSEAVVTVVVGCLSVRRFDIATGKVLENRVLADYCDTADTDTDGTVLAVWRRLDDGQAVTDVFSTVDGRRLARSAGPRANNDIKIVSSDPVIVASGEESVVTRAYDASGEAGTVLLRGTRAPSVALQGNGQIVLLDAAPDGSGVLRSVGVTDGVQQWARSLPSLDSLVGQDADALVTLAAVVEDGDDEWTEVVRVDRTNGARALLGYLPGEASNRALATLPGAVLAASDGTLTRYDLPAEPVSASVDDGRGDAGHGPDDALDACAAISDETLTSVGAARSDDAAPGECRWAGPDALLTVRVSVANDTVGTPEESAQFMAEQWLAQVEADANASPVPRTDATPVERWGDAAWVTGGFNADTSAAGGGAVVRVDNVVVSASVVRERTDEFDVSLTPADLDRTVLRAVDEVFASLGLEVDGPDEEIKGADLPEGVVCGDLTDDVRRWAGGRPVPEGEVDGPAASCSWEGARISAYVVPDGLLDAKPAEAGADAAFLDTREQLDGTSFDLGDDAQISVFDDGGKGGSTVVVRQGSLLVQVDLWSAPRDRAAAERGGRELARAALHAFSAHP